MDRVIVYPGQIVADTDTLTAERNTEQAIGHVMEMTMGSTGPYASGLSYWCSGSDLKVYIGPGQIVAAATQDPTAYGSLGTSSDQVMRQYVATGTAAFTLTTSATADQTFYIYATLSLEDTGKTLLRYYDAADETRTLSGVSNSGASDPTLRQAVATIAMSTTTPPDGSVPLWRITLPAGAATLAYTMVTRDTGAPFYPPIPQLAPINSPVLTGTPQAPTPVSGDSSTRIATTAFVTSWAGGNLLSTYSVSGPSATDGGYNSFTLTLDQRCRLAIIEIGAGGGGGGAATAGSAQAGVGGGGGAGAHARLIIRPDDFGSRSIPVVLGCGGRGGVASSGPMSGNNGGNSSLGSFLTLGGGGGGNSILAGGAAIIAASGGGGTAQATATTGVGLTIVSNGNGGNSGHATGMSLNYFFGFGGMGASSPYWAGGAESGSGRAGNTAASGAGGSGACAQPSSSCQNGGDGGPGWLIVSQYG